VNNRFNVDFDWSYDNRTIAYFDIPSFVHPLFTEDLKMDFNGFLSALGGNFSLWVGASFIAVAHLVIFIIRAIIDCKYGDKIKKREDTIKKWNQLRNQTNMQWMQGDKQTIEELKVDVGQTLRDILPTLQERLAAKNQNTAILRKHLRQRGAKMETFKALEAAGITSLHTLGHLNSEEGGEDRLKSANLDSDQEAIIKSIMLELEAERGENEQEERKMTVAQDVSTVLFRIEQLERENGKLKEKVQKLEEKFQDPNSQQTYNNNNTVQANKPEVEKTDLYPMLNGYINH